MATFKLFKGHVKICFKLNFMVNYPLTAVTTNDSLGSNL